MLWAPGPSRSLSLLLLLLASHRAEGGPPPLRRFEYKLSFKGARLALPGAGIPFWSLHGDAIPGLEEVQLVPSMRNRRGAVWSKVPVPFPAWEVEVQMRVTGPGRRGAQGMAVWYTRNSGRVGPVLEGPASWDGVGIFFNSSAQDGQNSPVVRVLASNGHDSQEPFGDRSSQLLGSCHWDFRNRPYPFRARIIYWGQRLRVFLSDGLTPSDPDTLCIDVGPLILAPGGFFGVSAATSSLADNHDVLSFLTFSLREPNPESAPQPFLEREQLRLARELEGLQAKLGLGTQKDVVPQPNPKDQEQGQWPFNLEETLGRQSLILQALQALSRQLARAEKQWKEQLESQGQIRPEESWDPAKVSTLLFGQRTLLQALQEPRDTAARMASRAQVFYLPVGTEHHFHELERILSLLQKDLKGLMKAAAKAPRPPGWHPGASACLRPGVFLFFLLIQTVGLLYYLNFSRQELDRRLQECLSTGSLPLGPAPHIPRALGVLRRQPVSPSMQP
uniref:protein ERGIC-53-like n=1 Tax=Jaculus jaculus TaxID=51337 RepID=UPI001E1B5FB1|nr:protein ERGIC-53-like [Jaculus jaculus]